VKNDGDMERSQERQDEGWRDRREKDDKLRRI
jgi:hypothetical protein